MRRGRVERNFLFYATLVAQIERYWIEKINEEMKVAKKY
jgi:hypothetical protein